MTEWLTRWRERWVNIHPFIRLLGVLLVLALGAWFVAKPAYRVARHWWYGRHLADAEQAVKEGRMEEAKELSQTILRAGDPRVLEALRVLEQSTTALRDPMRVDIATALMSHPKGTREDRVRGFRLLASDAPLGLVGQAWVHLQEEDRTSPDCAFPFVDRLIDGGLIREAAGVVQGTPNASTNWEAERRIIRLLIASGNEYAMVEAHNRLDKNWPKDDKTAGLDLLEMIPVDRLKPGLLGASAARLDSTVAREALMLARLAFAKDSSAGASIVDQALAEWRGAAPLELAGFLQATGMRRRLMEEFPPSEIAQYPGMAEMMLESAVREEDWPLAKEYVAAGAGQLDKLTRLAWTSAIHAKSGDAEGSDSAWREALIEAETQPEAGAWLKMASVMRFAGLTSRENECTFQAVLRGRGKLPLFADLRPLMDSLYAEGREKALMQVCSVYLLFEPGNAILLTHYAYLACISGSGDPEALAKAMDPLAAAYESMPHIQSVLAAIHLSRGDVESANRIAERVTVPAASLPPGYRAALLCARVMAGTLQADSQEVRDIPWPLMMPSERRFFGRFLPSKEQRPKDVGETRDGE